MIPVQYVDKFLKMLDRILYNIDHGIPVERNNIQTLRNWLDDDNQREFFNDQSILIKELKRELKKQTPVSNKGKVFHINRPRKPFCEIIQELDRILKTIAIEDKFNLLDIQDIPEYLKLHPEIEDQITTTLSCDIFRECRELFRSGTYLNSPFVVMLFCQLPFESSLPIKYKTYSQYAGTNWCDAKHGYVIPPWVAYVIRCGIFQKRLKQMDM